MKPLRFLIILISIISFSIGLFVGMLIVSEKIVPNKQEISQNEINAVKILADYYGDGIKRLDKIPADSLDMIIKKAGF